MGKPRRRRPALSRVTVAVREAAQRRARHGRPGVDAEAGQLVDILHPRLARHRGRDLTRDLPGPPPFEE